jgi:hypothetical protein
VILKVGANIPGVCNEQSGTLSWGGNDKEPLSCSSADGLGSDGSWTVKTGDPRVLDRGLSSTCRF